MNIYGYKVSHCKDCGCRFLDPPPDEATLRAIHVADCISGDGVADSDDTLVQLKGANAKVYLDLLAPYIGKEGQLLDIGCGRGELLLEARARGFEVTGVEISPYAASIANQRLGDERVLVGSLESLMLPEASFDAVVLANVIEYIREPLPFLRQVHSVLKPQGAALVVTPSLDSWSARLMRRYWMEYMPEHLLYFSERSMKLALEEAGFPSVALVPDARVLSFDYMVHRFQRFPVPVVTPIIKLVRRFASEELSSRKVQLAVSDVVAVARKSEGASAL